MPEKRDELRRLTILERSVGRGAEIRQERKGLERKTFLDERIRETTLLASVVVRENQFNARGGRVRRMLRSKVVGENARIALILMIK